MPPRMARDSSAVRKPVAFLLAPHVEVALALAADGVGEEPARPFDDTRRQPHALLGAQRVGPLAHCHATTPRYTS